MKVWNEFGMKSIGDLYLYDLYLKTDYFSY